MRINRISIKSFGRISNWNSGELDEGLNVIYGPNESGKSTITEFIRTTLFPSKSKYPAPSKTDSGTIELSMDNGERRTLIREQKKVNEKDKKRTISEEFNTLDSETYRSLFGLDLEQLNENKVISSDKIKGKFLTIPGGEKVPQISGDIEDRLNELLTQSRVTDTTIIGSKIIGIRETDGKIAEIQGKMDEYNSLAEHKFELEKKINEQNNLNDLMTNKRKRNSIIKSQKPNIDSYNELNEQLAELKSYESFDNNDKAKLDSLKEDIEKLKNELPLSEYSKKDLTQFTMRKDDINNAWGGRSLYISNLERQSELRKSIKDTESEIKDLENDTGWTLEKARNVKSGSYITKKAQSAMRTGKTGFSINNKKPFFIGAGILFIVAIVMLFFKPIIGGILIAFAVILAILPIIFREKKNEFIMNWGEWIVSEGYPKGTTPGDAIILAPKLEKLVIVGEKKDEYDSEFSKISAEIGLYERMTVPLIKSLKLDIEDIAASVEEAHNVLVEAEEEDKKMAEIKAKNDQLTSKKNEYNKLVKKYGSEEELIIAYENKKKCDELDNKISTLKNSIESTTGMDINNIIMLLNDESALSDSDTIEEDIGKFNEDLGTVKTKMDVLMNDNEIDELQIKKAELKAGLRESLREWATYSIAQTIVREACDHFYSDLQPTVIKATNRYLSLMTNDRYKLDNDPRNEKITVIDKNGNRSEVGQWSSGLTDQIYLSLKMALAQGMGTEKMPLILDDILVRFDDDRKEGACRAIYEYANNSQVIMFTFDKSVVNLLRLNGNFKEMTL